MKIEGYFRGLKNANLAVEKLKSAGFKDCFADLNDHYVMNTNPGANVPGTDAGTNSQASLVLNSGDPLEDPRLGPLAAASPMVSGMGGFEEIADVNYKVIVNADKNDVERVKMIMNENGADLRDPNFRMPEGLENIPTDEAMERMVSDISDRG